MHSRPNTTLVGQIYGYTIPCIVCSWFFKKVAYLFTFLFAISFSTSSKYRKYRKLLLVVVFLLFMLFNFFSVGVSSISWCVIMYLIILIFFGIVLIALFWWNKSITPTVCELRGSHVVVGVHFLDLTFCHCVWIWHYFTMTFEPLCKSTKAEHTAIWQL